MRYFDDADVRRKVNIEFANFSDGRENFANVGSLRIKVKWMQNHGGLFMEFMHQYFRR